MTVSYSCFKDKVAVVTGAGGGVGLALAEELLHQGAIVGMIDVKEEPPLDPALKERRTYFQIDLTDEAAVAKAIRSLYETHGRLDYLANVAGVLWFDRDQSFMSIDLDVWDKVFDINLKSMVHTCRSALPLMEKGEAGAIVNFSTIQALRAESSPQDAYACSKAAVIALSKSVAMQYAAKNIRSNAILPGPVDTPLQVRFQQDPGIKDIVKEVVPLRRVASAQDVANAAVFLLSDAASYITGTDLLVDGGMLMKL